MYAECYLFLSKTTSMHGLKELQPDAAVKLHGILGNKWQRAAIGGKER